MDKNSYFADIKEMFEASKQDFERKMALIEEDSRKRAEEDRKRAEEDRKRAEDFERKMALIAEESRKRSEEMDKGLEKLKEQIKNVGEQIGYIGRTIGEIVELILIPGICEKMNLYGHNFTIISPNKRFKKNKRYLAEIDLFLENCEEIMAVEIKSHLTADWVNRHLQRLSLLRENESVTGLRGKVLYAAVAGITIDEDARVLALNSGVYVVDMIEDEDRIEVSAPKECGKW